jgi:hypothetical protein
MISTHESNRNNRNPYSVIMEVAPELAAQWLEGNTHNRPLRQPLVDRLARDIKAGQWRLTHQGIAFDTDGVLIDGQHRLWAIVLAVMPVQLRVFFNEPIDNMKAVDTGLARSNYDVLHLSGEAGEITVNHLATLRAMLAGDSSHLPKLTISEEQEWMTKHADAVNFAMEHLGTCRFKGVATATIRGIIARAYYSAKHAKLIHFCDVLKTGRSSDDDEASIVLLWQFLVNNASAGKGHAARRLRYGKAERALIAYLRGERIMCLRAAGGELFPLPEEFNREVVA